MKLALLTALFGLVSSSFALADVRVVGSGPGEFTTIGEAVNLSVDGDTVLVKLGSYHEHVYLSKAIHLVGDGPGSPGIVGNVNVVGLASHQEASCANFEIDGKLHAQDCAGRVLLQDLRLQRGGFIALHAVESHDHLIDHCAGLVMQNCLIVGRTGASTTDEGARGAHGLRVSNSEAALYACRLLGGTGGDQTNGHYIASGGGSGGDALWVDGSTVSTGGTAALGGEGGIENFAGTQASSGQGSVVLNGGVLTDMLHARFYFELPSLNREGQTPDIVVRGPEGASVAALVAGAPGWRNFGASIGILHLVNNFVVVPLGTIPSGGELTVPFPTFGLSGAPADRRHIQLFATTTQGRMVSDVRFWNVVEFGL